jgi:xanthine dehydrogenase accessory factor
LRLCICVISIVVVSFAVDIYEEIVALRRSGRKGALATITNVRGSIPSFQTAKMLVRDDGSTVGTVGGGCVEADVWQAAREVMEQERPRMLTFNLNENPAHDTGLVCGGTLEIFVEPVLPSPSLYLFGAGHVSQAISRVASLSGFTIHVIDDREIFSSRDRFPEAATVTAEPYESVFSELELPEAAYIVISTRGHRDDMRILRWAVQQSTRYLGMIGSRRKVLTTCRELMKEGLDAAQFGNLRAPMGIEIGAVTPEEIAVSVVAEMIAVRRNQNIASLSKSRDLDLLAALQR